MANPILRSPPSDLLEEENRIWCNQILEQSGRKGRRGGKEGRKRGRRREEEEELMIYIIFFLSLLLLLLLLLLLPCSLSISSSYP